MHLLRPIFFHLQSFPELHSHILSILQSHSVHNPPDIVISPWSSDLSSELRYQFRNSLRKHLFGWDILLSLRLKISLADFARKTSKDALTQAEYSQLAQFLLNTLSPIILRTIICHLRAVIAVLTQSDVPFLMRIAVQSALPSSPPDLAAEAHNLSDKVHAALLVTVSGGASISDMLNEPCPACGVQIALDGGDHAVCSNGHSWGRCSVTSFILSTPMTRTCIGCSRKAFLPLSSNNNFSETQNWLPTAAQSWVVEELLNAVHRCLFCGNTFIRY